MGERAATHSLDVSDYPSQAKREDTLFNDLWSQGCDSFGDWIPNAENKLIHSRQQRQPTGKAPGFS